MYVCVCVFCLLFAVYYVLAPKGKKMPFLGKTVLPGEGQFLERTWVLPGTCFGQLTHPEPFLLSLAPVFQEAMFFCLLTPTPGTGRLGTLSLAPRPPNSSNWPILICALCPAFSMETQERPRPKPFPGSCLVPLDDFGVSLGP